MKLKSAMTPAQKQQAYRDRQRENTENNSGNVTDQQDERIRQVFKQELETVGFHEMNKEQQNTFAAHILLKIMPELANKELMKALFVIVMTDHNLN